MAEKAEKAVWDDAHVVHFISICKEEIANGNRPLGFLNPIGWKNLVEKFEARTGKNLTRTQLKNKWDSMKKEYTWFMELKIAATGLGWDDAKQTVDASKEWWDEHLQVLAEYFLAFTSFSKNKEPDSSVHFSKRIELMSLR
ncbi:hypothetical protein QYE76_062783 [Lolium multiflorum]|uniref:Myb/SANT-like domain-containing protein n=1 Tax=Lolium multiflorum TaxID=4521 RepID=A0AAD8S4J2_LOLMU|nr:hypothetical protein QYE76_062783 [Lolium multiflorum]